MFTPSEAQAGALARMEAFANIRSNRVHFDDKDSFQAYWDLIKQRCDRERVRRETETPESRSADRQRKQERSAAYYNNEHHLVDYARRYDQRYQPSLQKLRAQLRKKTTNEELCELVAGRVMDAEVEQQRANSFAEHLKLQGRTSTDITQKMRQRLFSKEAITASLATITEEHGSVWDVEALDRTVAKLRKKGLSQRAIRGRLVARPADAPLVSDALNLEDDGTGDDAALEVALRRAQGRGGREEALVIRKLQAKGFRYADIRRTLDAQAEKGSD